MPPCSQCGRPAIVEYTGGLYFCVDCNLKYQQAQEMIMYRMEREHNRILDDMDMVSGIPTTGGRYPERRPPVTMSGTFNTIRIDRSNVGVVNTGTIQSVQVSLTGIEQGGNPALAKALKEMTEAVINSGELQATQKSDAVQMLETVAAETVRPKEQRHSASMRAVLSGFADIVKVGAALAALWAQLGPTIMAAFWQ
jgi:hypothetical protein